MFQSKLECLLRKGFTVDFLFYADVEQYACSLVDSEGTYYRTREGDTAEQAMDQVVDHLPIKPEGYSVTD